MARLVLIAETAEILYGKARVEARLRRDRWTESTLTKSSIVRGVLKNNPRHFRHQAREPSDELDVSKIAIRTCYDSVYLVVD